MAEDRLGRLSAVSLTVRFFVDDLRQEIVGTPRARAEAPEQAREAAA